MERIKSILDFVNTFSRRRIEIRQSPLNLVLLRNTRLYHPRAAVALRVDPVINISFKPLLKILRFESTLFKYFILNKPSFSAPETAPPPVPGPVLNHIFNASSFIENTFGLIVTKDKARHLKTMKTYLNIMGKPVFVYRRVLSSEAGETVSVSQTLSNRIFAANRFIKNVLPTQRNHGAESPGNRNVQQVMGFIKQPGTPRCFITPLLQQTLQHLEFYVLHGDKYLQRSIDQVSGETGDTVTVSQTLSNHIFTANRTINRWSRFVKHFNRTQRFYPVSGDSHVHFSFVEQPKSIQIKREKDIIPGATKRQPGGRPRVTKTPAFSDNLLESRNIFDNIFNTFTGVNRYLAQFNWTRCFNPVSGDSLHHFSFGDQPKSIPIKKEKNIIPGAAKRQIGTYSTVGIYNAVTNQHVLHTFNTFAGVNRYLAQFNRTQRFYPASGEPHVHIHSFKQSISPHIKGEREYPFHASPGMDLKNHRYPYLRQHIHTHHDGYPSHPSLNPAALEMVTKKIKRNEKQINLEEVEKTIYRKVSKQVEQTIHKTIDRRMAFDSHDTHRLTENIYSRLVNRIVLEKERMGY